MDKIIGTLVRQLRSQQSYFLRGLAQRSIDVLPNFLSKMELGHFPPPSEKKIALIAETLEQNKDELLALAGKVSSNLIEIILQRPKETAALLRRLSHALAKKIAAANAGRGCGCTDGARLLPTPGAAPPRLWLGIWLLPQGLSPHISV